MATNQQPNIVLNLLFNVAIPILCLLKFSSDKYLGPQWAVVVALSFPLIYGLNQYRKTQKIDFIAALGIISVLLIGGISLLELPPEYIAIKEAAIPFFIGAFCIFSLKTKYPLVKTLIYSDRIFNTAFIEQKIQEFDREPQFQALLKKATWLLACFFFSKCDIELHSRHNDSDCRCGNRGV